MAAACAAPDAVALLVEDMDLGLFHRHVEAGALANMA
jgi:hypothetical protein